ncbi:MAG: hypothetical protein AB7V19_07555 [Candidatus Bipolaricaulia bacterium]
MASKKSCFIIMPISTPETHLDRYRDGTSHFLHVLDCLFIPAVTKAGYEPVRPIAKGADLIHAEIIKNLETADVVLCDVSCLNPNVLFELGIRTALNKPVCIVKDDQTKTLPFDTGIVNHQEYEGSIDPWKLEAQVEELARHLTESADRSEGQNSLWRHLGLRSVAQPVKGAAGDADKLSYLMLKVDAIQRALQDTPSGPTGSGDVRVRPRDPMDWLNETLWENGLKMHVQEMRYSGPGQYEVWTTFPLPNALTAMITRGMQREYPGNSVRFVVMPSEGTPASSPSDSE